MRKGDKVRIIKTVYDMFEPESEHIIHLILDHFVYLVDPFHKDTDQAGYSLWPFLEYELELVT